jgi:ABC-2 type transport system permease protein
MNSKTWLVAHREYLENLRTKTFWIGIIAFPVIIAVTFVVAGLMSRAKDERRFAVIDHSGWVADEVRERWLATDINRVFAAERPDSVAAQPTTVAEVRAKLAESRAEAGPESLRAELIALIEGWPDADLQALLDAWRSGQPPIGVMLKHVGEFEAWAKRHPPEKLAALARGLTFKRFTEVPLEVEGDDPAAAEEAARQRLRDGELFAYFVIGKDPVASSRDSRYVSNNLTDDDLRSKYADAVTEVVRERRIAKLGLTKADADSIQRPFRFDEHKVSAAGKEEQVKGGDKANKWAPVGFVYLLWIAVFTIAQMLLTNTIEEKSTRLIEVLLSSVSPFQLMTGKILGIAATGLTVIAAWVAFALLGVKIAPSIFPALSGGDLLSAIGDARYLASFVGYFLAGYLLFAAVLVAIGSVCNSLKEAQNLMQPVMILLIVPLLAMVPITNDPNGTLARILTYIPLYTPFSMMNRASGPPPAWEYVASTLLIVVSIAVAFWGAGKIFRIGVLMTGKPPKLREILGWLTHRRSAASATNLR